MRDPLDAVYLPRHAALRAVPSQDLPTRDWPGMARLINQLPQVTQPDVPPSRGFRPKLRGDNAEEWEVEMLRDGVRITVLGCVKERGKGGGGHFTY